MPEKLEERIVPRPAMDRPSDEIQESVILRKVALRLLPFLFLLYIVNIVDRMNVGFAKLKMMGDLGLDEKVYGLGAGLFYVGYMLFEVPSNLILHRIGARRWISRIMVSWGIVSACMMFAQGEWSFLCTPRPARDRRGGLLPRHHPLHELLVPGARAGAGGGLVHDGLATLRGRQWADLGALLEYTNKAWGLAGWQWLFLLEGIPAVILGFVTWSFLTDRPEDARWLEPGERDWLSARMAREEKRREARHGLNRLGALRNPQFVLLILLYFTIAMGTNGYGFFAPTIIDGRFPNLGADKIGLLYAIPSTFAAIGMVFYSRHSDRSGERRRHLAAAASLAAIGWVLSATVQFPWLALMALTLAFLGMMCMMGPYWSLATSFLSGTAAAGGIALINTIANAGGVLSPSLMGWMKTVTGTFTTGQVMLALTMLAGSGLALCIRHVPEAETAKTRDSELS